MSAVSHSLVIHSLNLYYWFFLQDCKSLNRFQKIPKPARKKYENGWQERKWVHPEVCCPEYLSPDAICTPSDPWCPTYEVNT